VLEGIAKNKRIASAYLFTGPPASKKGEAAAAFAEQLGCRSQDKITIKPDGAALKIDQVRELQQLVRYGPSASEFLIAVVEQADTLTAEAAAAFLKTLEEPPPGVVFILLLEREDQLPLTIVSRCQKIIFGEDQSKWEPHPEFGPIYSEIRKIREKNIIEIFELASSLGKEKDKIENLLYDLVFFARYELKNLKLVRILLEAAKKLKKKANLRLTLEVALLKCQTS